MARDRTQLEVLESIEQKLSQLIAIGIINGKPEATQLVILRDLGLSWPVIGTILGLAPDTARIKHTRLTKPKGGTDGKEAKQ